PPEEVSLTPVTSGTLVVAVPAGVPWSAGSTELVRRFALVLARRMEADERLALQQQRIRELAVLAEIARIVQSGSDVERLYAGFAQALRRLVAYRRLYVARLDETGELQEVPLFQAAAREAEEAAFSTSDGAHRWFTLRRASQWRAVEEAAPGFLDTDDRAGVVIPMRPKGLVLGAVILALDDPVEGDQLKIIEQAVEQLGLALDSVMLYQQATARASHIQTLSNLARIVASVVDLREAFAAFAEEVRWLIPFERAVMLLLDEEEQLVEPYAAYPDDLAGSGPVPLDGSIAAVPVNASGAVSLQRQSPAYEALDWSILGPDVHEVAAVPVRQHGRTLAVFALVQVSDTGAAAVDLDAMGEVAGLLAVTIERLRLYERAEHSARHDLLTGLPNYRYLQDRLSGVTDGLTAPGESALLMVDMDGLKLFNDTLGHEAGDRVIRLVGRELRQACRADDFVARTGGDEFILLMEGAGPAAAEDAADRIHAALANAHREVEGAPARIGVSIGIATAPDDAQTTAGLLHAADQAMYQAKFAGGYRTVLARDRTTAQPARSVAVRDTRVVETVVAAAVEGATPAERMAVTRAQRWTVRTLASLDRPLPDSAALRMLATHAALPLIADLRSARDQETARAFLRGVYDDWARREEGVASEALRLAAAAARLAWLQIP
ncbi:MAG: sensor domain-containing diguanylate cyclase, partial [Dehalococcoidia bacterium]